MNRGGVKKPLTCSQQDKSSRNRNAPKPKKKKQQQKNVWNERSEHLQEWEAKTVVFFGRGEGKQQK